MPAFHALAADALRSPAGRALTLAALCLALATGCSRQARVEDLSGALYCAFAGKMNYYDLDKRQYVKTVALVGPGTRIDSFDVSWDRKKILLWSQRSYWDSDMRRLVVAPMSDDIGMSQLEKGKTFHDFMVELEDISYTDGHLSPNEKYVVIDAQSFSDVPITLINLKDKKIAASWSVPGVKFQEYGAPVWTLDNQIYFRIATSLYRVGPADGYRTAEKVLSFDKGINYLTVNPQGTKLVFRQKQHLWLANLDGTDLRQITTSKTDGAGKYVGERRPTFSPDGKYLAFTGRTQRGAAYSDHNYPDGSWVAGVGGEFGYVTVIPADGKLYDLDAKDSGAVWLQQSKEEPYGVPCDTGLIWR